MLTQEDVLLLKRRKERQDFSAFRTLIATPAAGSFTMPANGTLWLICSAGCTEATPAMEVVGVRTRQISAPALAAGGMFCAGWFERGNVVTPEAGFVVGVGDSFGRALPVTVAGNPPPPSCTITLTGDIAALFGGQPMTIVGQTVSAVQIDPPEVYAASTDYITMTPPPASGIIITEVDFAVSGGMAAQVLIGDMFSGSYIGIDRTSTRGRIFQVVGNVQSQVYVSEEPGVFTLGYGSDGTLYAYVDGVQVSTSAMDAILPFGAFLTVFATDGGNAGDTASVTFRTDGSQFQAQYVDPSLRDWCGQVIV